MCRLPSSNTTLTTIRPITVPSQQLDAMKHEPPPHIGGIDASNAHDMRDIPCRAGIAPACPPHQAEITDEGRLQMVWHRL